MPKFIPRERKHKGLARNKKESDTNDQTNDDVHIPSTKAEKEERHRQLQDELSPQQEKVSSKKRKRLDKYIETKLKKEESLDLLKKLAAHKIDTSLLQSAKRLGRVHETKREQFERALNEREAGIDILGNQDDILFQRRDISTVPQSDDRGPIHSEGALEDSEGDIQEAVTSVVLPVNHRSFGSGLKRPLDTDEYGKPLIKRRKRKRKIAKTSPLVDEQIHDDESDSPGPEQSSSDESEWLGFDSDNEDVSNASRSSPNGEEENIMSSEPESDDDESDDTSTDKPARLSAFKAWADSQRNHAVGFTPSAIPVNDEAIRAAFKPREPSPDPVASEIASTSRNTGSAYRPAAVVVVPRSENVQEARLQLPVVQDEQKIMEAVHGNLVTVVCGATGSGKTTQLPQMLIENGYASRGMIGVTQPRRVAATSVANRVKFELGSQFGGQVAHQVRYDSNVSRNTKIKFMTDGILLREISQDFALNKYSAIVIDEAHERSVNTDILIGMLSRVVPLRHELSIEEPQKYHPLKLIVMSATLRVSDFILNERLFKNVKPPVVQAEGRQYHVTEHFARRTQRDYVSEMVRKVSKGHRKLPPGSILVFLTGQDEIQTVSKRLKEAFASERRGFQNSRRPTRDGPVEQNYIEEDDDTDSETEINGLDDDGDGEFEVENDATLLPHKHGPMKAHVLLLYAALPADQQMQVFEPPPDGTRAIILATNVAETSLTIPGIKYVFDCGRSKEKHYDTETGVQEFRVDWISKASASQRMGRAGRTSSGHCYRLYSSAIFEQYFEQHSLPEILRTPLEATVLQLKDMEVDNVVNFPFPTPPQNEQLAQAERLLKNIGAIDAKTGRINEIGKELIYYPVNPRFGKMLLLGLRNKALAHIIALVAGLAIGDLFIPGPRVTNANKEDRDTDGHISSIDEYYREHKSDDAIASKAAEQHKQAYGRAQATLSAWDDRADAIKLLTAVAAHAQMESTGNKTFCADYFLREKGMKEVQQLRQQLHNIMQAHITDGQDAPFKIDIPQPQPKDISLLKQIIAAGYIDQVAVRADLLPTAVSTGRKPRRAIEVPYRTLIPSISESEIDRTASIQDQSEQRSVYVHPNSVLARLSPAEMPPYIVYSSLSRAATGSNEGQKRIRMHPLTTVGPKQLAALAEGTPLLDVGKPIGTKIEEREGGKRRECWVSISLRDPSAVGTTGWPLPAWKVVQVKKGKEWVVEKVLDRGR